MGLASGVHAAEQSRVFVAFKPGQKAAVSQALQGAGANIHYSFDSLGAFAASVPATALKGLQRNPNVLYVEDDPQRFMMAESSPYGIAMVQANDPGIQPGTALRKICIIDSGIDRNHEDFQGIVVNGSNDPGTGNWFEDQNHHGTHVAGTIAAIGGNNAGVVGVLPSGNVALHIVKVFGADGWAYSSTLVHALDVCESAGANVVSMSLGGSLKSRTEDRAFAAASGRGVLAIAAAGNDGNTRNSYPASYSSVVSVAAIDSAKVVAPFSQQNAQVELAGPGVAVRSTVPMGTGKDESVTVAGASYEAIALEGSPNGSGTGALVDCGIGDTPCAGAGGKVCLIQRGVISFAEKVQACEAGGGIAAVIFNNAPGLFSGTLGTTITGIPSAGVSGETGSTLSGQLGASATVAVGAGNYAYFDGTSMATPHVSGVAALVWSNNTACSNEEIRSILQQSAEDLGPAGRDAAYGFGLVQASDAVARLTALGCSGTGGGGGGGGTCDLGQIGDTCNSDSDCCSNSCKGRPGNKTCK